MPSIESLTFEGWLITLITMQIWVSYAGTFLDIPLLKLFDIAVLVISGHFVIENSWSRVPQLINIYKSFLIRTIVFFLLALVLSNSINILKTTFLVLFSIQKLAENKIFDEAQLDLIDTYNYRKNTLRRFLNANVKWLDLLNCGYFLCNSNLELAYHNRKGEQILKELSLNFKDLTRKLTNINDTEITLKEIIEKCTVSSNIGEVKKAEFSYLYHTDKGLKDFYTGELLCNYKAKILKLSKDYILLTMKKKNKFNAIVLNKRFGVLTKTTLSHELKTLLNAIIGNLDLIKEVIDKKHNSFFRFALSSSHMLSSRLNDFFDYIQIHDHEFKVHNAEFLLEELIKELKEICQCFAQEKSLKLFTYIGETVPHLVNGDRPRIKQILLNLLNKAIEYTDYGVIALKAKINKKKNLTFHVDSIGTGMHHIILSHHKKFATESIKERFMRSASNPNEVIENMEAMYLEIAQLISKELGTKIFVKSKEKGFTRFSFSLYNVIPNNKEKIFKKPTRVATAIDKEYIETIKRLRSRSPDRKTERITTVSNKDKDVSNKEWETDLDIANEYITPGTFSLVKYSFSAKIMPTYKKAQSNTSDTREKDAEEVKRVSCSHDYLNLNGNNCRKIKWHQLTLSSKIDCNIIPLSPNKRKVVDDFYSCNILIVDDNMSNRFILKALLKKRGFASIEAQDGSYAVNIVSKYISSGTIRNLLLIFMDLQMPRMNGVESTKQIIELCKSAGVHTPPIIGVSSDTFEEDRKKFEKAGIKEFISKPLDNRKIDTAISKYVKNPCL